MTLPPLPPQPHRGEFDDQVLIRPTALPSDNPIDQVTWMWPIQDRGAWDGPRLDWVVHRQVWYAFTKSFDVVVQAGGCCGMYPRMLANDFKMVYTFEPTPLSFHCLVNNCQSPNIVKFNAALSDKHGMCSMDVINPDNVGTNTVKLENKGNIPVTTIDSLCLNACDLIALDLEGAEPRALQGARETIMHFRPTIVVELGDREEIRQVMKSFGYWKREQSVMDSVYTP